ncbi:MAG: hypothetical protein DWQ01_16325 [Planctomycetota bacterium]|nr:MAG: hypothetical protein DWQ01_16325 [Planctomycetota bacterium]
MKFQQESEYDRLDRLVREAVAGSDFHLDVVGWTRKTYDVYQQDRKKASSKLILRLESFATSNGEIRLFDEIGLALAEQIGRRLEENFPIQEAVLVRGPSPQ